MGSKVQRGWKWTATSTCIAGTSCSACSTRILLTNLLKWSIRRRRGRGRHPLPEARHRLRRQVHSERWEGITFDVNTCKVVWEGVPHGVSCLRPPAEKYG